MQKLPIPVNIITGHLSAGKTTIISSLLTRKPATEHWAILVNEFGALGIDAALLEGASDGVAGMLAVSCSAGMLELMAGPKQQSLQCITPSYPVLRTHCKS